MGDFVAKNPEFGELAKSVAMQVAASPNVEYVSTDAVPAEKIEYERKMEMGAEDLMSKPEEIRAKIVDGRINKILKSKSLVDQPFIRDPSMTVNDLVVSKIATLGENIKIGR